ncbi:hypothetical protein CLV24_11546 [Pontibacter ummariensis]|uniref:Uncharacterized protein n=1 Tax=Pontibacter ummariensis TaxID=1610492 RepID=A0A239HZK3_9BACT|nr:hypothetical protein [Pontibacter ummariensis]PRY10129.1 hypothetical protein CLV24_11546 [Pontibacter ummariensis]SNS86508.1 hypothetical protein SAMN06296052_11546 [Pontibacter ummariensis]
MRISRWRELKACAFSFPRSYTFSTCNDISYYVHNNPVEAGFVSEPEHGKYSSAKVFSGGKGVL